MAKIGFARVSTYRQSLDEQIARLSEYGCERVFQSKHSSQIDTKKALEGLLNYVRDGDTVIVTKLDRLGRSLSQVLFVLDQFKERSVNFVAIDQYIDTTNNDPLGIAMVQLLGLFAEMERSFIVSRTQEGKRFSGNYGGRKHKLNEQQRIEVKLRLKRGESKSRLSKELHVSRATILNIERS